MYCGVLIQYLLSAILYCMNHTKELCDTVAHLNKKYTGNIMQYICRISNYASVISMQVTQHKL